MNALADVFYPSVARATSPDDEGMQNVLLASLLAGGGMTGGGNVMAGAIPSHLQGGTSAGYGPEPQGAAMQPSTGGVMPEGDVFSFDGLNIDYRGDPNHVYGRSASADPLPFQGIVFHHTADGTTMDAISRYGHMVDEARGGSFGYHFMVGPDGSIIQNAPLSKRTNHVLDHNNIGINNRNAIGVSLVGAESGATPAQQAAAQQLAMALGQSFGIGADRIFGHAEVQNNKQPHEGVDIATAVRAAFGG